MTHTLIDGIANISFYNGILRIECIAAGPDGKPQPSGTLMIPGAVAGPVLAALSKGTQDLEKKMREQQQQAPTAGNA